MSLISLRDFRNEATATGRVSSTILANSNTPKASVFKFPKITYTLKPDREPNGYFTSERMLENCETSQAKPKCIQMPGLPLTATLFVSRDCSEQPEICKLRELKVVYSNTVDGAEVGFALFDLLSASEGLYRNSDYFIEMDGHSASALDFHEILASNFGRLSEVLFATKAVGYLKCIEFKEAARGVGMDALQLTLKHLSRHYAAQLFVVEVHPVQFEIFVDETPPADKKISSEKDVNSAKRKLTQLYTKKLGAQELPSGALAMVLGIELAPSDENPKLMSIY